MNYTEIREGFESIHDHYGELPDDHCGAFCNTRLFMALLKNPSKRKAAKIYSEMIDAYWRRGHESLNPKPLKGCVSIMPSHIHEIFQKNGNC